MDDVIALLQQLMQQAGNLADDLSEAEMQQVLTIFNEAIQLIQEQGQQAPIETPEQAQGIENAPFPSSNINGFNYNPDSQELKVQFHGPYPQAAGPIYSYSGVPKYIFDIFARGSVGPRTSGQNRYHKWQRGVTPSHGAAMSALIKAGGFQYQRLS